MNFKTTKGNLNNMMAATTEKVFLGLILIILIGFLPDTSYSQSKMKVKKGLRSHTFKVEEEIFIQRNSYDELEIEAVIQGFTQNEIILSTEEKSLDTIAVDELYIISTHSKNIQLDDVFLIPVGISLITLYISPFTGFTKDGYKPKNVLIVGGSAIAFNGIVFGLGSIGRAKYFRLCESKVKIK